MIIDITQTTKIGRVYRVGSEPLKVEKVTRYSKSGSEYTTTSFSCDVHNMGTHIDVMNPDVVIENERRREIIRAFYKINPSGHWISF